MENAKCYAPQILVGTEGLPREQWLEYRRKGIGGSDAAAVLGISPFRTGRDLYYDKLNIVTADDAENWVGWSTSHWRFTSVGRCSRMPSR